MDSGVRKIKGAGFIHAALLGIICPIFSAAAIAAGPPGELSIEELRALSLEDLVKLKVTSVSKKPQLLSRAAAAVHVLTSEDIRRSGATSIPEALRLVPGVQVARLGSSTWAISARGFNGPLANKLLGAARLAPGRKRPGHAGLRAATPLPACRGARSRVGRRLVLWSRALAVLT